MTTWKTDDELFGMARKELFVALVGDVLDKIGFQHQFLPPSIKPIQEDFVVIGRAMPVLEADVYEEVVNETNNPVMLKPFGLMFQALDDLKQNEVYICTGASPRYALWGGLMSTRAIKLGAAGAVLHGYSTDTKQAPIDVIDIYHTHFQIEFGFRDAKQFTGLENSQARSGNKLNFHFNAALTKVNIAKIMQLSNPQTRENSFSMATYKILFHNTLMLSRFFRLFAINPNSIKNRQHVNELLYFGTMAA